MTTELGRVDIYQIKREKESQKTIIKEERERERENKAHKNGF